MNPSVTPIRTTLLALLALTLLAGCSSTRLESSWKSPEATPLAFTKVLVVAPGPDGVTRRTTEDALAKHITTAQVVTSYSVLPDGDALKDHAKVSAVAKEQGAQGIVVLRLVANHTEVNYAAGAYPAPYYGFRTYMSPRYGLAPMMYEPAMVSTTKVIGVETNLYRVTDDKLVWSGLTRTSDPGAIDSVVAETVEAVRAQLKKDKLIP